MALRKDIGGGLSSVLAALEGGSGLERAEASQQLDRLSLQRSDASALVEAFHRATERLARSSRDLRAQERDEATRAPLARALQRLGTEAAAALPELIDAIGQAGAEVSDAAVLAVEAIGPETTAALLLARLSDERADQRRQAARALRDLCFTFEPRLAYARAQGEPSLGPRCLLALLDAAPELARASHRPEIRITILSVLGYLGPAGDEALDALVRALADGDEAARREAALALGRWGPGAAEATAALEKLLDGPLRGVAAAALARIGVARSVVALERALALPGGVERGAIAQSLERLRPALTPLAPPVALTPTPAAARATEAAKAVLDPPKTPRKKKAGAPTKKAPARKKRPAR
jgi:HEAT repeat protein